MEQYQQEIILKVNACHQTQLVESMKSSSSKHVDHSKLGVSKREVISKDRLMSIILYTDHTDLSSHFTSTFRKLNIFEPIQSTKNRHTNHHWMSKLLKETVQVYGHDYRWDKFSGPFFCGMSTIMTMPQFSIKLHSPTSTSCHQEVACKFSGESGIIIQFDNSGGTAVVMKGLDVSWLSRFRKEDER